MTASVLGDVSEVVPVRVCGECRRAKTIRGIWYIVPGHAVSPFMCETCFSRTRPSLRGLV